MRSSHSIRAGLIGVLLAMLVTTAPRAQAPAAASFTVFFRSAAIGAEQVTVQREASGWSITSNGRVGPPVDMVLRNLHQRYDAEWRPIELTIDATIRGQTLGLHTTITGTSAKTVVTPATGAPEETTETIDPQAILLPNPFIAPYEALAARLQNAAAGSTIAVYQPPQSALQALVGASSTEQIQTLARVITARRTRVTMQIPAGATLDVEVWADESGRLLRVSIPSQQTEFVREDVASVSARRVTMSRPNDENIRIDANGFSLAGTLSRPANATGPLPAVILLSGSGLTDRDETVAGIPIFGQLAGALADAGFAVLRYDKRGVGQSGGRPESATLADFADDARAVIKAVSERKDVDRKRVVVLGHSEGGLVASLASAKNSRVTAVVLAATTGVSGRELNLYQVTHALERSNRPEAEKQTTIELQKKIQEAVLSGSGWDKINATAELRRQADTPWFQSFLAFDPAKVMKDLGQPLLIVQGELDTQVPPSSADRLEELARARKKGVVDVVKVRGVNHLLVPAITGETDEYGRLTDRQVSPAVTNALTAWLQKTLPVKP